MKPLRLFFRLGVRLRRTGLWLLAGVVWAACAQAAEPSAKPELRIEAGMHTAPIQRIATDAQGRWVVTASHDKTARVWDLATGQLVQILRVPIADGDEGLLHAAALSPDGATVAVGGLTSDGGGRKRYSVYLFDRASARLLRRLGGLPGVVRHLAWRADGQFLAATLGDRQGVRIWPQPLLGSSPFVDSEYGDDSLGAAWSPQGDLATTSADGDVRLYRVSLQGLVKQAQVRAPGGRRPYGVAFAPVTGELALGYTDTTRVDILDGATLAWRYSPETHSATEGSLSSVAWSADGRQLMAGGRWERRNESLVRIWPDAGRGASQDVATVKDTLMGLVPLRDGRMLAVGKDPAWGVLVPAGPHAWDWKPLQTSTIADLRGSDGVRDLGLSEDGLRVQFGFASGGSDPYQLDVLARRLTAGRPEPLPRPRTEGLPVQDWEDHTRPTLAGQRLPLDAYERSRSLAVAPDNRRFVLGANATLRCYSAQGQELWQKSAPSTVWGVHIAPAAQLVVAAYGDGTIRWHRLHDGQELLAFFPHADRKRWVLWTPSGYYDTSLGGEALIGWHVNRGADAPPDFFPVSRLRNRYYRPDVIDRILQTGDEGLALAQADAERGRVTDQVPLAQVLPPVVEVLSGTELRTRDGRVTVRVRARTAVDAPVIRWQIRVNGLSLPEARGVDAGVEQAGRTDEREWTIPIPGRDSTVQIFAVNRHAPSMPATVHVAWAGPLVAEPVRRRLFVVAVGVARYPHPGITPLHQAQRDATALAALLGQQKGLALFDDVQLQVLTEAEATRDNLTQALAWLQERVGEHDLGVLFMAGHGLHDPALGYTFLPWEADLEQLERTGVTTDLLASYLRNLRGRGVVFLDTCRAGSALAVKGRRNDATQAINQLSDADNGVVVFGASAALQDSYEDARWGHGAFTLALLEGLSGRADYHHEGRVGHADLALWLDKRVRELTQQRQTPVKRDPGSLPNFDLVAVPP